MIGLPSFNRAKDPNPDVHEEKKEEEEILSLNDSIDNEEEPVQQKDEEPGSPTQVTATLNGTDKEAVSAMRFGVDLLDELEKEYSCGLSRRLTERKMAKKTAEEGKCNGSGEEEVSEKSGAEGETKEILPEDSNSPEINETTETPEEAPISPKAPTRSWKRILSGSPGGVLTREQALELTIETLRHQLEDITEQRDSLLSTVDTLEGKLDAQNAKIEALEYFFRRVNAREEGEDMDPATNPPCSSRSGDEISFTSSSTTTRSVSRSLSNTPSIHSFEVSAEAEEAASREEDEYEDDEAWELEAGPPKLSVSFQKTGQKMRSAKTRAAAKLSRMTCV
eukprot:scaffold6485_cov172-Amphora_coffeaeformis.AAC.1